MVTQIDEGLPAKLVTLGQHLENIFFLCEKWTKVSELNILINRYPVKWRTNNDEIGREKKEHQEDHGQEGKGLEDDDKLNKNKG